MLLWRANVRWRANNFAAICALATSLALLRAIIACGYPRAAYN
jgi:hypothetical protein